MFKSVRFYIILSNKNLIIKKENDDFEKIIDFPSFIPNVPFYYHFFDDNKTYIGDLRKTIKKLRIKNLLIIVPDDVIDIEVDKKLISEFFMFCGVKKVQLESQSVFLNLNNKRYISISRTSRTLVLQYIINGQVVAKIYFDKNYSDIKQIELDVKKLHPDCEYEYIPLYINNINNDMEQFNSIGESVSLNDIIANIMNCGKDN